jgi:FAD/FMN-containing dehydrogenase
VAGHVLGGGYGYLARAFGLCCDSLLSVDLVDPQGRRIQADETQNPDLLWACRGGGGGCFGVATGFQFKLHPISNVLVFQASWLVKPGEAVKVIKDWQAWAPHAPQSIHAELSFNGTASGDISLRILGQSIGTPQQLRLELETLTHRPKIQSMPYSSSINYFAGQGGWTYASAPMKGKSDYVLSPLTNDGLLALITEVSRRPGITVICDPYGGAIAGLSPDATAFVHRAGTLFGIQYLSWWYDPSETEQRLANMRSFYAAMRPHVSGGAYVNYCDLDLSDWQNAYWGSNVPRLKSVKSSFDPDEVFRHAQSIPRA